MSNGEALVVYAQPIMRVSALVRAGVATPDPPRPGFEWSCPACGVALQMWHPEGMALIAKERMPVEPNQCGNPKCDGHPAKYFVAKQLVTHKANVNPQQAMAAAMARMLARNGGHDGR